MADGKVNRSRSSKIIFMSLSKDDISKLIRARRYAALYRYIDHLKEAALKRRWEYSRSHGGYDAAAIPSYVYRYWYHKALEVSPLLYIECEPYDFHWILDKLLE